MVLQNPTRRRPRWLKIVLGISVLGLAMICIGPAIITFWPDVAAQNIDRLRDIIGDAPVAQLEATVLSIQDYTQQLEYKVGLVKPAAPWADSHPAPAMKQPTPTFYRTFKVVSSEQTPPKPTSTPSDTPSTTPTKPTNTPTNTFAPSPTRPTDTSTNAGTLRPTNTPSNTITPSSTVPTNTPLPSRLLAWQLSSLTPLGKLAGEGRWSPYLYTADGQTTVAYRTFLQPDPLRPYSIPAIVAFDLQATRLHFVLGTVEPMSAMPQPARTGAIPPADLQPGVLLATFNGGFKARHGHYGAMADGLIALPAINGRATVAIYADGQVQIGEWGTDIKDSPDLVAWRQNGVMLIHNGQINPDTARTTVSWGLTIKGNAITWRSALGLSADKRTLYYVAGLQLDVATLTKVMAQAGAAEALQLDVNTFWVHFAAIRSDGSSLVAEPLLKAMKPQADRYLMSYSRDFFYVTTATKH
ncbi:MAG: phosphodiester glycosidase family protein [Aggregatilineales bacterium]